MYNSEFEIGQVALNVRDIKAQSRYYQKILGLKILSSTNNEIVLGTSKRSLLKLLEIKSEKDSKASYGLYHFALLLPNEVDFANIFKHFIDNKIPLIGGSDHGYSQALYLEDLEGNGIEIYYDKDISEWDIREDGKIVGVTEELDANSLYAQGKKIEDYELPVDTKMGHIHLSVRDSKNSSKFYQEIFAMGDKFTIPSASWLASGNYHHHLAVNEWLGKNLLSRDQAALGLAYFTVIYKDRNDYENLLSRLKNAEVSIDVNEDLLIVTDIDGIQIRMELQNNKIN
ncbi:MULTISPECIES: VOC family protein [unclassified Gemella]|uniref:VOC family protein n=1 Tax=unclassified Gemella TaxID=2624949 RepID=UPI001074303F|nr:MULTISPECIES: VOC family protein [unclassified Gemella]MBF0709822.1 VOC family protein [Gemella sp. GL1.1]MBF0747089.1 VOC family protein [Gemella sp. 19428wG2_WT2a]NYS27166.1 VOC family protein [Gemella sp. GL1]TFU58332.1 VOC family protein [Gemella sp. WT2a]